MNAALVRRTLRQLEAEGVIEQISRDQDVVVGLQSSAAKHIRTANAGVTLDDYEGAFQLAYDTCRKVCTALVLAAGYRPVDDQRHHVAAFEAAAALAQNFGRRPLVEDAANLRFVRHGAEYRGEDVDREDAEDAISIAADLVREFDGPIKKLLTL